MTCPASRITALVAGLLLACTALVCFAREQAHPAVGESREPALLPESTRVRANPMLAATNRPLVVTLNDLTAPGPLIPEDFVGLSFESANLLPDKKGDHLFSAKNKDLIDLFRLLEIKNLRIGGGTAELPNYSVPGPVDIDNLFGFARLAGVKVIYTLRLLNGNQSQVATIAKYIATHYRENLVCFCLGNEPDWHAYHSYPGRSLDPAIYETTPGEPGTAYPSYLARWRKFAAVIRQDQPAALFGGPDTGSNFPVPGAKDTRYENRSWTEQFAWDEQGGLTCAFLHDYVGQSAAGVSQTVAIDSELSRNWVETHYSVLQYSVLDPLKSAGMRYRITECNDYTGGVDGASNAFASALWALDYLHWHAAHLASGVNFHNKRWIYTCTIYQDSSGKYQLNPKAYGLKAFALGSRGSTEPLKLSNPGSINLTAYAVRSAREHFVTLINKEHGDRARPATVLIKLAAPTPSAKVVFLSASGEDPAASKSVTLGGTQLNRDTPWHGEWKVLSGDQPGCYTVRVAPASAAIISISRS